jgi:hypothetical protein
VELEHNSSSSTSLSRTTTTTAWHNNSIGKHAWLAGQATIASTQKQGGEELTGVLTREQDWRPWRQHDGAATVVAARPPSRGCTGEGAASCSRPSGQAHHGGDVGVATAIQPTQRRGGHRKHRRARAGAPAKLAGVDQPHGRDLLGRSSTAMAAIGGEDDETPRSGGSARRGGADTP